MKIILSLSLVCALAIGIGCQSASSNSVSNVSNAKVPVFSDEAPRITLEDAKKDFDAGNAIFVDSRSDGDYKNEHIKGAINIPIGAAEARWKEIPTDKKIIAYCS
jgi:3-mercaptopyruvate sulfurtransferase SseA